MPGIRGEGKERTSFSKGRGGGPTAHSAAQLPREKCRREGAQSKGGGAPDAVHKGRQEPPARTQASEARRERLKVTCAVDAKGGDARKR